MDWLHVDLTLKKVCSDPDWFKTMWYLGREVGRGGGRGEREGTSPKASFQKREERKIFLPCNMQFTIRKLGVTCAGTSLKCFLYWKVTVPKDLVALMSAVGTGSSVHPQNPDLMVFTFTQKVFYIHTNLQRTLMVLICQVVVKEVSFEWSHCRISLNLNQPVQYYINYIPGGGGYLLSIMAYMERPRPKGYLFWP